MAARGPILIVDDNEANLKLARVTLELEGYEVVTAADAEQARAAVRERKPRLILMDIQLPGTDGLTLTRELKADPATSGIAVIALTAYAMKGDDAKAREAGCDGYIAKPIDTRALPGVVASHLQSGARLRRLLVVEDDPSFGKLLGIGLRAAGFDVNWVQDPDEARAALQAGLPDLVVLDGKLRAPGDGLRFCRELKAGAATAKLPVIMLSGTDAEGGVPGTPGGPDLSLTKAPDSMETLPARVRALLKRDAHRPS